MGLNKHIVETSSKDNTNDDIFQTKFIWCWCCLYETYNYAL